MISYIYRGELSYEIYIGEVKKPKLFPPGSEVTGQIYTVELTGVDSAGVLRQSVDVLLRNSYTIQSIRHCKNK